MFITLRKGTMKPKKNVLIAGDTAGVFWALSHIVDLPLRAYIWDTGIHRPLREFPCYKYDGDDDKCTVYYDYQDYPPTRGVVVRMDRIIAVNCENVDDTVKMFTKPALVLDNLHAMYADPERKDLMGMIYGYNYDRPNDVLSCKDVHGLVQKFVMDDSYEPYGCDVRIDTKGDVHICESGQIYRLAYYNTRVVSKEWSALQKFADILSPGEMILHNGRMFIDTDDIQLADAGIHELEIVSYINRSGRGEELAELSSDEARVFGDTLDN